MQQKETYTSNIYSAVWVSTKWRHLGPPHLCDRPIHIINCPKENAPKVAGVRSPEGPLESAGHLWIFFFDSVLASVILYAAVYWGSTQRETRQNDEEGQQRSRMFSWFSRESNMLAKLLVITDAAHSDDRLLHLCRSFPVAAVVDAQSDISELVRHI